MGAESIWRGAMRNGSAPREDVQWDIAQVSSQHVFPLRGVGAFTPYSPYLNGTILEAGDLFSGTWCVSSPMVTAQSSPKSLSSHQKYLSARRERLSSKNRSHLHKGHLSCTAGLLYFWQSQKTEVKEGENMFPLIKLELGLSVHVPAYWRTFHALLGTF